MQRQRSQLETEREVLELAERVGTLDVVPDAQLPTTKTEQKSQLENELKYRLATMLNHVREMLTIAKWIESAGMTVGYGALGCGLGIGVGYLPHVNIPWFASATAGTLIFSGAYRVFANNWRRRNVTACLEHAHELYMKNYIDKKQLAIRKEECLAGNR